MARNRLRIKRRRPRPAAEKTGETRRMRPISHLGGRSSSVVENGLVSVILVNYNGVNLLPSTLRSLFDQTYRHLEVFLFDNGSSDGSPEYVRRKFPRVRVIELGRNTGFSWPNNEGIRRSIGQYVLTLNTDVILANNFIEELVNAIETNPNIGWAAGKMLKLTKEGEKTEEIDCLGHHFHRDRYAKETDYSQPFIWSDYSQVRYVFGASACAALYRRAMLEDVALGNEYFDEDFVAYWEDVDLDWRAQLRGWKCFYVPTAVAHHVRGGSGLYRRPEIAAHNLANRFLIIMKNDESVHLLRDGAPFLTRTALDMLVALKNNPLALPIALRILRQKTPRIMAKRTIVQRNRIAPSSYIRSLIR
jgi:GT2 family glycosyltransferase